VAGGRLAEGLHHAHERGVLHRDVKPANILITDEGLPMLLDFNVAEDVRQHGASAALLDGTLPYMAPEHLAALRGDDVTVDARADVYSLGIVLFELLAGRFPFSPAHLRMPGGLGSGAEVLLVEMLEERRREVPCPRKVQPSLSPATGAIVRRCLAPDPARRYASARDLQEDLERQLADLPLRHAAEPSVRERGRKWVRRHPKLGMYLSSGAAVLLLLAAVAFGWRARSLERAGEARRVRSAFAGDYRQAQFLLNTRPDSDEQRQRALHAAQEALAHYDALVPGGWRRSRAILHLPEGEREVVLAEVGELLLSLARLLAEDPRQKPEDREEALRCNRLAEACFPEGESPRPLWSQRAWLCERLGEGAEAKEARRRARERPVTTVRDRTLEARDLTSRGRFREAMALLAPAVQEEPSHFWAWFLLGLCREALGQDAGAVTCYTACVALLPRFHGPYVNRGLARLRMRNFLSAKEDFDRVIELAPHRAQTWLDRALAREGLGDHRGAEADLTKALSLGTPNTRVFFLRARVRAKAGDQKGAEADRAEGLRRTPTDELSWIARGLARLGKDAPGALEDFEKALAINPGSRAALMNKAHVLAEIRNKQREARIVLERVLSLYPDHVPALSGLAVVLARLGERGLALERISAALERDARGQVRYQAGCVYALTSRKNADDAATALVHLRAALNDGYGADFIHRDEDLAPLRDQVAFRRLLRLAAMLRQQK
jgi:tetratricopeptide (TPR) repeat protein